jgi:hypothetical protein
MTKQESIDEILERLLSEDRLSLIFQILAKASTTESLAELSSFHDYLTVAEICFLSFGIKGQIPSDSEIKTLAEYVDLLEALGVPINVPRNKMSKLQIEAWDSSEPYLSKINEFRGMWKKANAA